MSNVNHSHAAEKVSELHRLIAVECEQPVQDRAALQQLHRDLAYWGQRATGEADAQAAAAPRCITKHGDAYKISYATAQGGGSKLVGPGHAGYGRVAAQHAANSSDDSRAYQHALKTWGKVPGSVRIDWYGDSFAAIPDGDRRRKVTGRLADCA